MNVPLDKALQDYVAGKVESGQFDSAGEVVRDALLRQREYFRRLDILRAEVQKGIDEIEAGRIVDPPPTVDELIASARRRAQQE